MLLSKWKRRSWLMTVHRQQSVFAFFCFLLANFSVIQVLALTYEERAVYAAQTLYNEAESQTQVSPTSSQPGMHTYQDPDPLAQASKTALDQKLRAAQIQSNEVKMTTAILQYKIAALTEQVQSLQNAVHLLDKQRVEKNTFLTTGVTFTTLYALLLILIILAVFSAFIWIKRKIIRNKSTLSTLLEQTQHNNEEIIQKLSIYSENLKRLIEIGIAEQKKSNSPENCSQRQDSSDLAQQHALVKVIADKLTFMEVTLSRMDSSIRGFKQLNKSITQIKDVLHTNGYDIIEMLGKQYNSGMKVIANFIDDEDLEKGSQIITGVTKPQINYHDVMIQSAQIVVTQNL